MRETRRYDQISDDYRTFTDPEAFEEHAKDCPGCNAPMVWEEEAWWCADCEIVEEEEA